MKKLITLPIRKIDSGQSLVETALFLPILLILLAGVVEISSLLLTQNRISNAARTASGFAAANFIEDAAWQGSDWSEAMGIVAINSVTETMDVSPENWDIWTIKATTNADGTGFVEWRSPANPGFGNGEVVSPAEWAVISPTLQADVLAELQGTSLGAADLQLVATVAYYKNKALLGLPVVGVLERSRGLSVMRIDNPAPYAGCDLFPIAVNDNSYSLYPSDYDPNVHGYPFTNPSTPNPGDNQELFPFEPGGNYGGSYYWRGMSDGAGHPTYTMQDYTDDPFSRNQWGIQLANARPGYIYKVKDDNSGAGNFGWLTWSGSQSAGNLADSLQYPGNVADDYDFPPWSDDGTIDLFDLVHGSTGTINSNGVDAHLQEHVQTEGRTLRLIVFTPDSPNPPYNNGDAGSPAGGLGDYDGEGTGGTGSNFTYEVFGYVVVRMLAYHGSQGHGGNWLLVEFVRWDESCGQ